MRKALKQVHLSTSIFTGVLLAISIIGGVAAWWQNERVSTLEGGVPLMPRSEVVHGEKRSAPETEIFNYTCNTRRSEARTAQFYRNYMQNAGWRVISGGEDALQFEQGGAIFRVVLHPQRFKTVFTLHLRQASAKSPQKKRGR